MAERKLEYFLRCFCPARLYSYSTKVRIPKDRIDFRKFLIAKLVLSKGGSVVDGGAHLGYHTRFFSELVGDRGYVYSFEPNPYIFRLLQKGTRFQGNVIAYQKALSDVATRSAFYVEPFSLSQDSTLGEGRAKQKRVKVESVCLDTFLSGIKEIRLIKLDVEGYELQAIRGSAQLIGEFRPWIIFEYVQSASRNDRAILSLLKEWGYACFDLGTLQEVPQTAQIDVTDMVAIPQGEEGRLEALRPF